MVPDHLDQADRPGSVGGRRTRNRDIGARIGALLLLGGAAITAAGTVLPANPEIDAEAYFLLAGLQAAAGLIVLMLPPRLRRSRVLPPLIIVAGVISILGVTYFNGERAGGPPAFNEFFFVWPAFYIGYFFGRRGIVVSLVAIAILYGALVIDITDDDREAFTRWIVTVSVVSGSAVAMHVLRMNIDSLLARLRETARTDPLTTLLNRRGFDERFALELDRSRRTGDPFALLVGDLDRFKDLNDRFGHGAGDTALVAVAQALASGSRSIDTVARIGGEEFGLLLPGSDCTGAVEAAERLRGDIAGIAASDGKPLTISFGVVEFPRHGLDQQQLLDAADGALYAAKASGRDRTVARDAEAATAPS
jgi:diguanylate cyclase (GGDEF)-like protein